MNKGDGVASAVVDAQISRMLEQERKRLVLLPLPDFGQECPLFSKDQMFEISLCMAVMMRISIIARFN